MSERLSAAQRSKVRRVSTSASEASAEEKEGGEINVVPFLDIITNVLMFVLATVAVTFTATIDVNPPTKRGPRPAEQPTLDLSVLVVNDGFSLKAKGGNIASGCGDVGAGVAVPKRDGEYDFAALRTCATKLKASTPDFAGEHSVTVTANPQVPYQVVIATVDAIRKSPDGDDLFPDVAFGVAR